VTKAVKMSWMPGVALRLVPVAADAEVIGYRARVNRVNGEIHSLDVNVLALSSTRMATWAIFRSQTTLRAMIDLIWSLLGS
jgi:hypothetical protein